MISLFKEMKWNVMTESKKFIKEWVPSLLIALVIALFFKTYVAEAVKVPTGSMIPTIQLNDRFIVEKMVGLTHFQFGDVVVFYPPIPDNGNERYVKRLIGLPGDTVEIKNGSLYRNGQKVDEPYIKEPMTYSFGPLQIPDNKYFFLGDNRNDSLDAHKWKTPFVDKKEIVGKVMFRIYPFASIGKL
jgi:signal peptidase I